MAWYKNRTMYLSAFLGGILGCIFLITGLWLELQVQNLPFSYWSYLYLHKTHYVFFLLDFAPFGFGILFGLVGLQRSLYSMISQSKKEWESTFDAFSDPIFITDQDGCIIRCNHAALDRLNSTYMKVLGKQLKDILSEGQKESSSGESYSSSEFLWFKRIYDMATCPIHIEGMPDNTIYILHEGLLV